MNLKGFLKYPVATVDDYIQMLSDKKGKDFFSSNISTIYFKDSNDSYVLMKVVSIKKDALNLVELYNNSIVKSEAEVSIISRDEFKMHKEESVTVNFTYFF